MDDVPLWWKLAGIAACLFFSAFFSATETALTATPLHKIRRLIRDGKDPLRMLGMWAEHPNRVLTSILIGNNLVNILAAALATDVALTLTEHWGVALATGALTILTLVFGEIFPKTLAKHHAETLAPWLGGALIVPYKAFYPVTMAFVWLIRRLAQATGADLLRRSGPFVTAEDLHEMIEMGDEAGGIEKEKRTMLGRVIEMGDTVVREVMVPRTDIKALPIGASFADVVKEAISTGHSRIPVYEGNLDNIRGFVYVKDLLKHVALKGDSPDGPNGFRMEQFLRETKYVPETKPVVELLEEFQRTRRHIAVVVDEYGGTAGLVTLEDILEEIVGEIEDEFDAAKKEQDIASVAPNVYSVQARLNLDEVEERLGLVFPKDEDEEEEYESLGGFVSARLGHVPRKGETLDVDGARLIVEDATPKRVLRVRIEKRPPTAEAAAS